MLRTIRLSGELGRKFGKYHRMDVKSPAEAIRALCANFAGFERFVCDSENRGIGYRVLAQRENALDRLHGLTPAGVISICPVMIGSKKSGLMTIAIGVALIAASFFLPGVGFLGAAGTVLGSISLSGIAFSIGASLFLSGISQMLTKTPKVGKVEKGGAAENYYFNGAINTQTQGGPVPVGYGRLIVGGAVVSAGMFAEERTAQ